MFETLTVNGATIVHANNKGASYTCMLTKGAIHFGDPSLGIADLFGVSPDKSNNRHMDVAKYLLSSDVDTNDAASTFAHIVRNDVIGELSADAATKALHDISKCVGFTTAPFTESASKSYIGHQGFKIMDGDIEYRIFITMRDFSIEIIILNVSDKL